MQFKMSGFKPMLRASLAVTILMTMLLATAVPAGAISSPISSAAPAVTPGNALDYTGTAGGETLLQFTSAGHVLGFSHDGVIIASADHMVKTTFIGSRAVAPEADIEVSAENSSSMASPLSRVTYQDAWDDVTVVYEACPGAIVESSYYINTTEQGIPVERIRLGYNRPLSLDKQGNLVIAFETGTIVESAPVAWQEIDGQRKPVTAAFALKGEREVGFSLGDYVPGFPVVIDPALTWNTFLGGIGVDTTGSAIAVDGSGNVYVGGISKATWGSPVRAHDVGVNWDAFAARLDGSGNLTWNTFLGGPGDDYGYYMTVDGSGNVYVTGASDATWGSPKRLYTGNWDAFAARLDSSGNLTWHTFLGGGGYDKGYGIAVDGSGNVYIGGLSNATWGSPVLGFGGGIWDAFAAKLDSSGNLTWHTFLGGGGSDQGYGIAVDGSGNVYVGGWSNATWGAPVRAHDPGANNDAFAAKLNSAGALTWNTFLGGTGADYGLDIAVDGNDNVYIAGYSNATWGSPVRTHTAGNYDAFAARLDSSGNLTWHTFLGGGGADYSWGIAVDGSGNVYVAGYSNATWGSPWQTYTGDMDAFAARLDSLGNLIWNNFMGCSGYDQGNDIAVDDSGNVYVAGYSPATWGSPVRPYTGVRDAFAAKIAQTPPAVTTNAASGNAASGITANSATLNISYTLGEFSPVDVRFAYKKSTDTTWTYTPWASKTAAGTHTALLTGLDPNTQYDFKVQLRYTTVIDGSILQFTTLGGGIAAGGAEGAATGESQSTIKHAANLRIAMLNAPGQAQVNQPITISANVVNDGSEAGSTRVALKINGQVEQTKIVTVGGGSSRPVKFTVTKAEPGTYSVIMGSQRASFVVTGEGATAAPAMNQGTMVLLIAGLVVLVFIIILAFAFRRKPTY